MVGVQAGGGAGDDLGEVYAEFIGHLVDDADGDVLAVLLVGEVGVYVQVQLGCQLFGGVVAGFPQLPQPGADLVDLAHVP